MNRPLLTLRQIGAIEDIKKQGLSVAAITKHTRYDYSVKDSDFCLKNLSLLDLIDALRVGYDAAPTYQVDQWVVTLDSTGASGQTCKISSISEHHVLLDNRFNHQFHEIRPASKKEALQERNLRIFQAMGRDSILVYEGDAVEYEGKLFQVQDNVTGALNLLSRVIVVQLIHDGRITAIYPVDAKYTFGEDEILY